MNGVDRGDHDLGDRDGDGHARVISDTLDRIAVVKRTGRGHWEPLVTEWVKRYGPIVLDVVTEEVAAGANRDTLQERVSARLAAMATATSTGADLDDTTLTRFIQRFASDFQRCWSKAPGDVAAAMTGLVARHRAAGEQQPRRSAWNALRAAWDATRTADQATRAAAWDALVAASHGRTV
jgi:hypothetical protein